MYISELAMADSATDGCLTLMSCRREFSGGLFGLDCGPLRLCGAVR
jgi:hypothetical protein